MDTHKAHLLARLLVTIDEIEGIPPDDYTERSGMTKSEIDEVRKVAYDLCREHGYGFNPTAMEMIQHAVFKAALENLDENFRVPTAAVAKSAGMRVDDLEKYLGFGHGRLWWASGTNHEFLQTDEQGIEYMREVVDFYEDTLTTLRG